ncbi:HD domain-containing protein [Cupriavidus basilensis]
MADVTAISRLKLVIRCDAVAHARPGTRSGDFRRGICPFFSPPFEMSSNAVLTLPSLATASTVRYEGALSHVIRTAFVAECLAGMMGLGKREQELIRLATRVHDVGKLALPMPFC